jgi:hypothetical protein
LLDQLRKIPWYSFIILIVFAIFSYFGEYPPFLVVFFDWFLLIGFVSDQLDHLIQLMSFNALTSYWMAARTAVFISFILNFLLVKTVLGYPMARKYILFSITVIMISAIASPFDLIYIRSLLSKVIRFITHPAFLLILMPVRIVYLKHANSDENF